MPEVEGWRYGDLVEVTAPFTLVDLGNLRTTDPLPSVGDVGEIRTINTHNGRVTWVGVAFPERSWVIPVQFLAHE